MTQPSPSSLHDAFLLGMDIEEIYMIFAEGFQLAGHGLGSAQYEVVERKVGRAHDLLHAFGCPADVIRRFEDAASNVRRADEAKDLSVDALADQTFRARDELGSLMPEVRGYLTDDDGRLYDLGVMLARLHLCVRILAVESAPAQFRDIYGRELVRVFPIVVGFLEEADAQGVLDQATTDPFGRQLQNLLVTLPPWDGGSIGWCAGVRERLDHLFGAAGMVARDAATGAEVRPTAALPPAFVLGGCAEEIPFLMAGWALDPEHVPEIVRPARAARNLLLGLGGSAEPLARFDALLSSLLDSKPDAAQIRRAESEIWGVMAELRESLTRDDMQLYDLGAATTRVSLFLRIARVTAFRERGREAGALPGAELEPDLAEFSRRATEAEVSHVLERDVSTTFADHFYRLRDVLIRWDGGSEEWCIAASEGFDRFFVEAAGLEARPWTPTS